MDIKNLKGQTTADDAQDLKDSFLRVCGSARHDITIRSPQVQYFKDEKDNVLIEMLPVKSTTSAALRIYFEAAGENQKIITASLTYVDGYCYSRRVGQGSRNEVRVYENTATWVNAAGDVSFYIREGAKPDPQRNKAYADELRNSAEALLKQVERDLAL